jgi:hypothetical protein
VSLSIFMNTEWAAVIARPKGTAQFDGWIKPRGAERVPETVGPRIWFRTTDGSSVN